MEDKELRKVFEDTTTNNVRAILKFSTETRKMLRVIEEKTIKLEETLRNQNTIIDALRLQLANVQTKLYSRGT